MVSEAQVRHSRPEQSRPIAPADERAPEQSQPVAPIDERLAHSLAHDMRSPLTAIQMCAEALKSGGDPNLRDRYAALISEQAQAIAWSLENLLALADDAAWRGGEKRPELLREVLDRAVDDYLGLTGAREVALDIPARCRDLYVPAGFEPLCQALRATLIATASATPQASALTVSIDDEAGGAPQGMAAASVMATSEDAEYRRRLADLELPWQNVRLLAAARTLGDHGGMLSEVRRADGLGVRMLLPRCGRDD